MKWEKSMTAYGVTVDAADIQAAWDKWIKKPPRTAFGLEYAIEEQKRVVSMDPYAMRIADRMLQKARKAGVIRYSSGAWYLCGKSEAQ